MTVNAVHPLLFGSPAEYLKQKSETLLYCQLEIRKLGLIMKEEIHHASKTQKDGELDQETKSGKLDCGEKRLIPWFVQQFE